MVDNIASTRTPSELDLSSRKEELIFRQWVRNHLGPSTQAVIFIAGDLGPREIGNLIRILETQKAVIEGCKGAAT